MLLRSHCLNWQEYGSSLYYLWEMLWYVYLKLNPRRSSLSQASNKPRQQLPACMHACLVLEYTASESLISPVSQQPPCAFIGFFELLRLSYIIILNFNTLGLKPLKPDESPAQSFLSQNRKFCLSRRGCRHVRMMGRGIVSFFVISDLWRMSRGWRVRVTSSGLRSPRESTCLPCYGNKYSTDLYHFFTPTYFLLRDIFLFVCLFVHTLFVSLPNPLHPSCVELFIYLFFKIVICGQRDSPDTAALLATVNSLFLPHKVRTWRGCVISNGVRFVGS